MKIAEYFHSAMIEKGLNNKKIAEIMGVDKSYISQILNGVRGIGEKTFTRLCAVLDLDEIQVRDEFGDQIAPRGNKYRNKSTSESKANNSELEVSNSELIMIDNAVETSYNSAETSYNSLKLTEAEENNAAELFINCMHMFTCELNDDGKRVIMAMMKMLTGIDAFNQKKAGGIR